METYSFDCPSSLSLSLLGTMFLTVKPSSIPHLFLGRTLYLSSNIRISFLRNCDVSTFTLSPGVSSSRAFICIRCPDLTHPCFYLTLISPDAELPFVFCIISPDVLFANVERCSSSRPHAFCSSHYLCAAFFSGCLWIPPSRFFL